MKAIRQDFPVVLFVMLHKVVLNFWVFRWNPKCDHSNEGYRAVLSCGAVYYAVQGDSNFWVSRWNPKLWPFKWKISLRLKSKLKTAGKFKDFLSQIIEKSTNWCHKSHLQKEQKMLYRGNPPRGVGGGPWNFQWGCAATFFKPWPYLRPKYVNFRYPFQISFLESIPVFCLSDQNGLNHRFPISDQNGSKTIPFVAAHTYIACIEEYPPPPSVGGGGGLSDLQSAFSS